MVVLEHRIDVVDAVNKKFNTCTETPQGSSGDRVNATAVVVRGIG